MIASRTIEMKTLLTLLLFIPIITFGQIYGDHEVALIKDKDGFTLIRKSPDKNSSIVDTLFDGEFFQYVKTDRSDWYKTYKMWNTIGYVHKSRIQSLKSLRKETQYNLIDSIFDKEAILYKERLKSTTIGGNDIGRHHHEEKFTPILDIFIEYMCESYNDTLMRKFFDIMIVESGSADETPPTVLGFIYKCQPELVTKLINEYNNSVITNNFEFGKANIGIKK